MGVVTIHVFDDALSAVQASAAEAARDDYRCEVKLLLKHM